MKIAAMSKTTIKIIIITYMRVFPSVCISYNDSVSQPSALLSELSTVIGQYYGIFTSNTLPPKLPPLERAIVPFLSP